MEIIEPQIIESSILLWALLIPAAGALGVLLLAQAVFSVSFGYNSVVLARKKQKKVAAISVATTVIVTGLSLLVALLKMNFIWISMTVLVGAFMYTLLLARLGTLLLGVNPSGFNYINSILPWGSLVSVLIFVIGILTGHPTLAGLIGTTIFGLTNRKNISYLWGFITHKIGLS